MICNSPDPCTCTAFNRPFCRWFAAPRKQKKTPGLKKTKIKGTSEKRKKELAEYKALRADFLLANPRCKAALPGCTTHSVDVHHANGRGINLNHTGTWIALCRSCHDWIHKNPREARQMGLLA